MKSTVKEMDSEFMKKYVDAEKYVLVHSSAFKEIYGVPLKEASPDILEGLVKISNGGNTIYRKCVGRAISGKQVGIGYRSRSELNVEEGQSVSIEKASWWSYYWHNSDSGIKCPFRLAVVSLIITIIGSIASIVGSFMC